MSIIKCFVCSRRYSDKIENCPECFYPTKQIKRELELENHFNYDTDIKSKNKSNTKEFKVKSWVERSKSNVVNKKTNVSRTSAKEQDKGNAPKKKVKIKYGIIIYIIWVFGRRIVSAIGNLIEEIGGTDFINRIISSIKELI